MEELGRRYMEDPELADELLQALLREKPNPVIHQAWLNCHWDSDTAVGMLIDVADFWDRRPEPMLDFMQACWSRNDTAWHTFIKLDSLEDDPELAEAMYRRFAVEGPTDAVVSSMLFLRLTPDSDRYAAGIIAPLLCRGMVENPCTDLLKLWRRYAVSDGIDKCAMRALRRLLTDPATAAAAVRVVQILRLRDCAPLLPQLAVLACAGLQPATRHARGILVGISDGHYAGRVARAVCKLPWHPYMITLHCRTQYRMLNYMRDERAMAAMISLFNTRPARALSEGVFTRIVEMDPDYYERLQLRHSAYCEPTDVHGAVYHMYMHGAPPTGRLFYEALREYPLAVGCIARRAPRVRRETTWARRKLLLCCLSAGHKGPRGAKSTKAAGGREGVLSTLVEHSCAWPGVLGFL